MTPELKCPCDKCSQRPCQKEVEENCAEHLLYEQKKRNLEKDPTWITIIVILIVIIFGILIFMTVGSSQ